ncbi:hypothetical protein [Hyphomicrobium sp.]|uniref:hypothetical protein n=1 Tax=Hyphomicrobium sp. TaxID=82 RepID=UPI001DC03251|nr:hypothetical protein [Hyphomicrobium sp.]MBY0561011.1 hypothetical protein [Hyphomicrobium sp.]
MRQTGTKNSQKAPKLLHFQNRTELIPGTIPVTIYTTIKNTISITKIGLRGNVRFYSIGGRGAQPPEGCPGYDRGGVASHRQPGETP